MEFFPRCSFCTKFSHFLIDEKVLQCEKIRNNIRANIGVPRFVLCIICVAKSQEHLTPDSILRDDIVLELLLGFQVSERIAEFQSRGITEILVISNGTRIDGRFKELTRKPLPKTVKLRKLFEAFARVHRMPFRDYGDAEAWWRDLQKKFVEISSYYLDARTLDMNDNFDLMVERTPLHERTAKRSQEHRFPEDSFRMRSAASRQEASNDSVSSLRSTATNRMDSESEGISSQSIAEPHQIASESFDMSSQSVERNSIHFTTSQSQTNAASISSTTSSSDDNTEVCNAVPLSPQPGPSGLRRPAVPANRRRPELPVNPSPESFRTVRVQGARLPRVPGG